MKRQLIAATTMRQIWSVRPAAWGGLRPRRASFLRNHAYINMARAPITLTGILATSDSFGRLRLSFIDVLPKGGFDRSWARLTAAIPETGRYTVPYTSPTNGVPDDSGIRGECWIVVSRAAARRRRILTLADELRGKDVVVTVRPKRYTFITDAGISRSGTALKLISLEAGDARSAPI